MRKFFSFFAVSELALVGRRIFSVCRPASLLFLPQRAPHLRSSPGQPRLGLHSVLFSSRVAAYLSRPILEAQLYSFECPLPGFPAENFRSANARDNSQAPAQATTFQRPEYSGNRKQSECCPLPGSERPPC